MKLIYASTCCSLDKHYPQQGWLFEAEKHLLEITDKDQEVIEADECIKLQKSFFDVYIQMSKYSLAKKIVDRCNELYPNHEKTKAMQASFASTLGNALKAEQLINEMPISEISNSSLELIVRTISNEDATEELYQRILSGKHNSLRAKEICGCALSALKRLEEAAQLFEAIIEKNPRFWTAYTGLAVCYHRSEDAANMIKALKPIIDFDEMPIKGKDCPSNSRMSKAFDLMAKAALINGDHALAGQYNKKAKQYASSYSLKTNHAKSIRNRRNLCKAHEEARQFDRQTWERHHGSTLDKEMMVAGELEREKNLLKKKAKKAPVLDKDGFVQVIGQRTPHRVSTHALIKVKINSVEPEPSASDEAEDEKIVLVKPTRKTLPKKEKRVQEVAVVTSTSNESVSRLFSLKTAHRLALAAAGAGMLICAATESLAMFSKSRP